MGRTATIKMNVLPRFIFLFQPIPVILKPTLFQDLNKIVMKFIWQGKKPRIKLTALQDFKQKRGLGLPDWPTDYKACTLV